MVKSWRRKKAGILECDRVKSLKVDKNRLNCILLCKRR